LGSIFPLGRGYLPDNSGHFVPGYYRAVPPGQNHSPIEAPLLRCSSKEIFSSLPF
jgi:hypothetical protein